jgi:hypothetical protein
VRDWRRDKPWAESAQLIYKDYNQNGKRSPINAFVCCLGWNQLSHPGPEAAMQDNLSGDAGNFQSSGISACFAKALIAIWRVRFSTLHTAFDLIVRIYVDFTSLPQ